MLKTNTYTPKRDSIKPTWHFIDAQDKILGKVAVEIAKKLTGKNKAIFTKNINVGDKVVVINAEKVKVTGKKLTDKIYSWHTGFPKGLRQESLGHLLERRPTQAVTRAVQNMLPNNKLRSERMANLYVYKGTEHPHKAQEKK